MTRRLGSLLRHIVGRRRLMPKFIARNYQGYDIGLRPHDSSRRVNLRRLKVLYKERLFLWPMFNGSDMLLDLFVLPTKAATAGCVFNYEWSLCSPDGKEKYRSGQGTADVVPNKGVKQELNLGHISLAGQYKVDMRIIDVGHNIAPLFETFADFRVRDIDQTVWTVFMGVFLIVVTTTISLMEKGCQIK
jgi:hypothetical protein